MSVLIAVLALGGCDALIARFILPSEGIRPAEYAVAVERNVTMTTSDAVALVADIHRPKMNGAAPTILVPHPVQPHLPEQSFGRRRWPVLGEPGIHRRGAGNARALQIGRRVLSAAS